MLVGLIIGVVTGTFLILSLVFVLCCACQGRDAKFIRRCSRDNYDAAEDESNNSLVGGDKNMSSASSNTLEGQYSRTVTTEESSLEMSDARSQSTQLSKQDIPGASLYPPPPSLYDTPAAASNEGYGILPTVNQHQRTLNPLYSAIQRQPGRESVASEELPLPPPPPPPHGVIDTDEEEMSVKGLNPTFKTYLDKTIAVRPLTDRNSLYPPLSPTQSRHCREGTESEKRGLMTSDL